MRLFFLFFIFLHLQAREHPPRFEGVFGMPTKEISNMTSNCWFFLPYNPIVVEVGAYEGEHAKRVAESYPDGHVFAFEPNPKAFKKLSIDTGINNFTPIEAALNTYNGTAKLNINHGVYCNDERLEKWSSLLDSFAFGTDHFSCFKGPTIEVPCVVLDDWCREKGIDHIDLLHLDTEGFELQILKSSPEILKTVIVIHTKTNLFQFRKETTQFRELHQFLSQSGFELLCHWYLEDLQGEATYIQKRIYDAVFR